MDNTQFEDYAVIVGELLTRVLEDTPPDTVPDTKLKTRHKQVVALELRGRGYTYEKIAMALSCSTTYVSKILNKALKEVVKEPAEDVLRIELQRLDALLVKPYEMALRTGSDKDVKSCLSIMERRAKLLGLDKMEQLPKGTKGGVLLIPSSVPLSEWENSSTTVHAPYNEKPSNEGD